MAGWNPTQEFVRELFDYDPETGIAIWKAAAGPRLAGKVAGHNCRGYLAVWIGPRRVHLHKLIWLWMTGEFPVEVDHRDLSRANNKWCNLRNATRTQNNGNVGKRRHNTSGFKGVTKCNKSSWKARITQFGVGRYIGAFKTLEEAARAYDREAIAYFGDFARTNFPIEQYIMEALL